ncbi:MAG: hypothetical protein IJK58_00060 [Clostridia bacterium]|nr:hypothetical protein [Clostridia bacterium]
MKFGITNKNSLSGAWLAIRLFQVISFVPAAFFLVISGYRGILLENNVLSQIFSCGLCALPCGETAGLSALYRLSHSEILAHFLLLGIALAVGLITGPILRGSEKAGRVLRFVMLGVLALDIPLGILFNIYGYFGLVPVICGSAIRLGFAALIVADLIAARKANAADPE